MPSFETSVDIDVDDYYNELSKSEKIELINLLKDDRGIGFDKFFGDIDDIYDNIDDKDRLCELLSKDGYSLDQSSLENQMKFEFIKSVWDNYSLPQLEALFNQ